MTIVGIQLSCQRDRTINRECRYRTESDGGLPRGYGAAYFVLLSMSGVPLLPSMTRSITDLD